MKMLAALALAVLAFVPALVSAQATDVTGTWNATSPLTSPDGRSQSISFTCHFTQKGKTLTGTIGPDESRQWKIEKGVVDGAKITFTVEQSEGPTQRAFDLVLAKGKLTGTMKAERATG